MLKEIAPESVKDYTDKAILIMQMVEARKHGNTYEFIPLCEYGTPKQIQEKLATGGIKVFREDDDEDN